MILYYIILGSTISKLFAQLIIPGTTAKTLPQIELDLKNEPWWAQVISHRITAILTVGSISLIFVFKKHLKELKGISYIFLTVVVLFISLLLTELLKEGGTPSNFSEIAAMKASYNLLTAFSILLFAYSF